MRKLRRALVILLFGFALLALAVVVSYIFSRPSTSVFHGKPEAEWITRLNRGQEDSEIRMWRELGPEAVPFLVHALSLGNSPFDHFYAVIQPKLPAFARKRLTPPVDYSRVRTSAAILLVELGTNALPAARELARAMTDPDSNVRFYSARALEPLMPLPGNNRRGLASYFITAVCDTNFQIRAYAAGFLGFYPEETRTTAPLLIAALHDPERSVRQQAQAAIGGLDAAAAVKAGLVPALIDNLSNQDLSIRVFAARHLGMLRAKPDLSIPPLIKFLEAPTPVERFAAASALASFGPQARAAIPALQKLRDAPETPVRTAATNALQKIEPASTNHLLQ